MAEGIHVEIILREKDDKAHKWHMRKIAELTIFNDVEMRVLEQTIDLSVQTIVRDRVKSKVGTCPKCGSNLHADVVDEGYGEFEHSHVIVVCSNRNCDYRKEEKKNEN